MSLILDGTNGVSDIDGTAATPAIRGTDTNTGIFFPAADTIAFSEGGTEVARFDAGGSALINLTSNSFGYGGAGSYGKLVVKADTTAIPVTDSNSPAGNSYATFQSANASAAEWLSLRGGYSTTSHSAGLLLQDYFGDNNGYGGRYIRAAGATIQFGRITNGTLGTSNATLTEHIRIDSSGVLLVGTTSSASPFDSCQVAIDTTSEGARIRAGNGTNGTPLRFLRGGTSTTVGTISTTSTATAYNTSSDYRLKENIAPMTGALSVVQQLKPCTYNWKVDGSAGQGFIAHELQAVVPDCVSGDKDAVETVDDVDAEGKVIGTKEVPKYQGIDTSFLVATLTAAIQELKATVDAQAARIAALENPPVESVTNE